MAMDKSEPSSLDYFAGGVPTSELFRLTLDDLSSFIDRSSNGSGTSPLNEVCFIGLVSYFEAFCKDHFACILNIEPTLLEHLAQQGHDVTIDPSQLLGFGDQWRCKIGFLVAEKYDFGTAQKINALYNALLQVTPFSKEDARRHGQSSETEIYWFIMVAPTRFPTSARQKLPIPKVVRSTTRWLSRRSTLTDNFRSLQILPGTL